MLATRAAGAYNKENSKTASNLFFVWPDFEKSVRFLVYPLNFLFMVFHEPLFFQSLTWNGAETGRHVWPIGPMNNQLSFKFLLRDPTSPFSNDLFRPQSLGSSSSAIQPFLSLPFYSTLGSRWRNNNSCSGAVFSLQRVSDRYWFGVWRVWLLVPFIFSSSWLEPHSSDATIQFFIDFCYFLSYFYIYYLCATW